MDKKLLIIADNTNSRSYRDPSGMAVSKNLKIEILTLGITHEHFRASNSKKHLTMEKCSFLNIDGVSNALQEKVRNFYTDFIYNIPYKNNEHLFYAGKKYMWWYLGISEKCPIRGNLIKRMFYLTLIRHVLAHDSFEHIYADIEDIGIRNILLKKDKTIRLVSDDVTRRIAHSFRSSLLYFTFKYIKNLLKVFLLFFTRSLTLDISGLKGINPEEKHPLVFFTNYPFWWAYPYDEKAKEKFFGSLVNYINEYYPAHYLAMLFSLTPFSIILKKKYLSDFFRKNKFIVLDRFLKKMDMIEILSFRYFLWAFKTHNFCKNIFKIKYEGFDAESLISSEMSDSLCRQELFNSILLEKALINFKKVYNPRALVYRIEFQPFEKALLNGVAESFPVIAFQHSTFSRNLLSHFFAPEEIKEHISGGDKAMPMPDMIFTAGKYFYDILKNDGFTKEHLDIAGAVRYSHLIDYLKIEKNTEEIKNKLAPGKKDKIFLIALNWFDAEVMALVYAMINLDVQAHLIFRSHPHMNYDKRIKSILDKHKTKFSYSFLTDSGLLYDAISASDGMVQILNTLCYEAIALGKTPILYENRNTYNINSSEELNGYVPIVSNTAELKQAMLDVINSSANILKMQNKRHDVIEKFFYNLDNDPRETFLELLIKHNIIEGNGVKNVKKN